MDPIDEDYTDASWHEQQLQERQMLDNDPDYVIFLNQLQEQVTWQ